MAHTISKEFHFSASHILKNLPEGHPCGRMHGHNYVVTVFLKGEPDEKVGFVQDYKDLNPIKEYIDKMLDHQHLNDVFHWFNPTVENMSRYLFEMFKKEFPLLTAIEMSETPKTNCRYEP
jgi:6-pyruvoyltetrahydropterin/6-carboxytetrahydropterin synthase